MQNPGRDAKVAMRVCVEDRILKLVLSKKSCTVQVHGESSKDECIPSQLVVLRRYLVEGSIDERILLLQGEGCIAQIHREAHAEKEMAALRRYVVDGSIEERMLKLQENKRELVSSAFDRRSPDQQLAMRINDIRLLMQL